MGFAWHDSAHHPGPLFFFIWMLFHNFWSSIWKTPIFPVSSVYRDITVGIATWGVGFPITLAVGQLCDTILLFFVEDLHYTQLAIMQLKMAMQHPVILITTLISIILFAPLIEEFLFRGVLQTYLRQHIGRTKAIALTSMSFALVHLAPSQGIGNIPLFFSLCTFSLFLGMIYERQRSLFASIALHSIFNTISALQVLFYAS